jgi:hypothetical protein
MIYKLASILIAVLFFSCSNVDPNNDPNELYSGRYGSIVQDTIFASADTVLRGRYFNTSLSTKISLGEYDGLTAGIHIAFFPPPDSIELDSVFLKFTKLHSFGPNANETISGMMYEITKTVGRDSINILDVWRDPVDNSFVREIGPVRFNLEDTSETSISLPVEMLTDWQETPATNNGLYFHPQQEDAVVELGSWVSSFNPTLVYFSTVDDSVVSDTLAAFNTATIFNYDDVNGSALDYENNKFIVSSGVISRTFLKFDLSTLPKNAIFSSANIRLTEDDLNPYENPENASIFRVRALEELTKSQDDFIFSPNTSFSLLSNEGFTDMSNSIDRTNFSSFAIQEIINGSVKNEWFSIEFLINNSELSVKRFWGVEADSTLRPKLIVKYLNATK